MIYTSSKLPAEGMTYEDHQRLRELAPEQVQVQEPETAAIPAPLAAWAAKTPSSAPGIRSAAPWSSCRKSSAANPSAA